MIEVLVVDDSAFMRKLISDFINSTPGMRVKDTARNGKIAYEKLQKTSFDVVTLDMEMPEMNGLETLKKIMKNCPLPVIIVSSDTQEGAALTVRAMEEGAVDVVAKPSGAISLDLHTVKDELLYKIQAAANATTNREEKENSISKKERMHGDRKKTLMNQKKLLAIGTSTGGPKALQAVLPRLKKDFSAPILIVQHMPPGFTRSLAERLNQLSDIAVKEAEHGELVQPGTAYICPGGKQMKAKMIGRSLSVEVLDDPPYNGHAPSVDVLLRSLLSLSDYSIAGLIMTGMGSDGAEGMALLKEKKDSLVLVESKKTAIVYGMPKSVKERLEVDATLDLDEIAPYLNMHF